MFKKSIVVFLILITYPIHSQVTESKWGLGVGGIYPRFFSVSGNGFSGNQNYGMYLSVDRFFNEYLSLRGSINFLHIESNYYRENLAGPQTHQLSQFAGNLDVLYRFLPCESISPYLGFGIGITNFTNKNSFNPDVDDSFIGYQVNFGLGVEWGLSREFSVRTEAFYYTASNNKIDGNERINENSKGFFGGNGDTYGSLSAGLIWYFNLGDNSDLCKKCPEGVREIKVIDTLYIERVKEVQKVIYDTVFVEKPNLFGVNFQFDKYTLSPESYPILEHTVKTLKQFPEMEVLISGHTDSYGSEKYNDKLSESRVNTVYEYLISNGIQESRIVKNWFGESNPIRVNDTDINRAFNRRVEIKVLDK